MPTAATSRRRASMATPHVEVGRLRACPSTGWRRSPAPGARGVSTTAGSAPTVHRRLLQLAEATLPPPVLGQRLRKLFSAEIRPERWGAQVFGIRPLPE